MQRHVVRKTSRVTLGRGISTCSANNAVARNSIQHSYGELSGVADVGQKSQRQRVQSPAPYIADIHEDISGSPSVTVPQYILSRAIINSLARQSVRHLHTSARRASLEPNKPATDTSIPPLNRSRDATNIPEDLQRKPAAPVAAERTSPEALQRSSMPKTTVEVPVIRHSKQPQKATAVDATASQAATPQTQKKLPTARKTVRLDDYLPQKKEPLPIRLVKGSEKAIRKLGSLSVGLAQWTIALPGHLLWAMRHPVIAYQSTLEKFFSSKAKIKHGWHHHVVIPYRLIKVDIRVLRAIFKKRRNEGRSEFTALEKRKLQSITADFLRFIPYSVFFAVPFMELLLPVYIWMFPSASPSWFESRDKRDQKLRTKVEFQRAMADFMVGTIQQYETKLERKSELSLGRFKTLMNQLHKTKQERTPVNIAQLREYIPLFNVHLNLNKLDLEFLMGMAKMLAIPTPPGVSNSDVFLRFLIRKKMRMLREEDAQIRSIGIENLSDDELIQDNVARGGRGAGMTRSALETQLDEWIQMNYENQFPDSLTLVVRANTASASYLHAKPKEIKDKAIETAQKAEQVKESLKEKATISKDLERKLLGQKYSLDLMQLKEIKLCLNDLKAIYRALEELCDIVNTRDVDDNVFSIKTYIEHQNTLTRNRADRMESVKGHLYKLANKLDVASQTIQSKTEKSEEVGTVDSLPGMTKMVHGEDVDHVEGHLSEHLVKQLFIKYYSNELLDGSVYLDKEHMDYREDMDRKDAAVLVHLVQALNPERDPGGVNVKIARKALESELTRISETDPEVKELNLKFKAKGKLDFNLPAFTESRHNLYNIGKSIVDIKLANQASKKKNPVNTVTSSLSDTLK